MPSWLPRLPIALGARLGLFAFFGAGAGGRVVQPAQAGFALK